jgi:signal transduction histidine kinase
VDGFSERSKIKVEVNLPDDMERLPRPLELVVFRVIQESLTNVHRHSGSPAAKICLTQTDALVKFEIIDSGTGMSAGNHHQMAARSGVGVRGMKERVRQFGGTFQIFSNGSGTRVAVTLPIRSE